MKCPRCRWPMHRARYVPGEVQIWRCETCVKVSPAKLARQGYEGFNGSLTLSTKVPVTRQEQFGA